MDTIYTGTLQYPIQRSVLDRICGMILNVKEQKLELSIQMIQLFNYLLHFELQNCAKVLAQRIAKK